MQGDDQRARVVVDAVAAVAGRHAERRVLDHPGVVGHAQQVIEPKLGKTARARGLRTAGHLDDRRRQRLAERKVARADARPGEPARVLVALGPQAAELRGDLQQRNEGARQRGAVAEGKQGAASIGEQLARVPVGRREHGRAGAHRVRERPAGHLRLVEIGAHEDVGRLQIAAKLRIGDVLVPKHDVLAHAQLLGLALERRPVGLAVLAGDRRVGRADDEVDQVGTGGDRGRKSADHRLDALVRAEQTECQQHALTGDAEPGLERLLIARGHVGDAVRDDVDIRASHVVPARQEILGDRAHHDDDGRPGHALHDDSLRVRGSVEHGVQRDHRGHAQRAEKIQDVSAVVAAEDAVFVLERHPPHVLVVDQLCGARVVGLRSLPNLVLDLLRVLVGTRLIVDGDDQGLDTLIGSGHSGCQVARERRDAAATGWIGADKGDPKIQLHGYPDVAGLSTRQQNPHNVAAGMIIRPQEAAADARDLAGLRQQPDGAVELDFIAAVTTPRMTLVASPPAVEAGVFSRRNPACANSR